MKPSGQTETVLVRFRPKVSAETVSAFGVSEIFIFGVSALSAVSAEIGMFRPK